MNRLAPLERLAGHPGLPGQQGLLLHEIYASIQGESTYAGLPCTFVRTTACNLRCVWCDTPHAFVEGRPWTRAEVLAEVRRLGVPLVEVTGGEPLLQQSVLPLMTELCDAGFGVLLETSGSLDITPVDPRVVRIVDFKAPGSGEEQSNLLANVEALRRSDEVKLVLRDRVDYDWAASFIATHRLSERCTVLLSPVWGALEPAQLAAWMREAPVPARLQIQLHKVLWDPRARGV